MEPHYLGNQNLLENYKTAFLCSRQIPASVVLKSYDWAIEQRKAGRCVLSGFQSPIEKDVLHFLLKGRQPVILVLARSLPKRISEVWLPAVDEGRLLIISPLGDDVRRITRQTASIRNRYMIGLADEVFIPYLNPAGRLCILMKEFQGKKIRIGFEGHDSPGMKDTFC